MSWLDAVEEPEGPFVHRPAVVVPPHRVTLDEVRAAVASRWANHPRLDTWLSRIDAADVQTRYWMAPLEDALGWPGRGGPQIRTGLAPRYLAGMADLMPAAARAALRNAGIEPAEVDALVVASMVFMVPGLDSQLVPQLGLPPTLRRLTTTQAGCGGGAWCLQRAAELIAASRLPRRVLVVCCDPLTYYIHPDDAGDGPMIFRGLLGEAAAAAVVTSTPPENGWAVQLEESYESVQPNDPADPVVGIRLEADGWHILSTSGLLATAAAAGPALRDWWGSTPAPTWAATHNGGPAVLAALAGALDLGTEALAPARASLRDYGNCGGASMLDALNRCFDAPRPGTGLIWAVGPGFTTHALKARWVRAAPGGEPPFSERYLAAPAH